MEILFVSEKTYTADWNDKQKLNVHLQKKQDRNHLAFK